MSTICSSHPNATAAHPQQCQTITSDTLAPSTSTAYRQEDIHVGLRKLKVALAAQALRQKGQEPLHLLQVVALAVHEHETMDTGVDPSAALPQRANLEINGSQAHDFKGS